VLVDTVELFSSVRLYRRVVDRWVCIRQREPARTLNTGYNEGGLGDEKFRAITEVVKTQSIQAH
jgi:hypothetical protein